MAGRFQQNPKGKPAASPTKPAEKRAEPTENSRIPNSNPLNHEQAKIRDWYKKTKFRKAIIGGVDEADVWKKLLELNALYEAALSAERARFDALLAEKEAEP